MIIIILILIKSSHSHSHIRNDETFEQINNESNDESSSNSDRYNSEIEKICIDGKK
jgi:hypothetical protein